MSTTSPPPTKPKEHLTTDEAHAVGQIVRDSPPSADKSILWAVRHHLGLYYHGLASAEEVCDALLRATNGHSDTNLVSVLGLERCLEFTGRPMLPRPVVNPLAEVLSRGVNLYRTYGLVAGDPEVHGTAAGKWLLDASQALKRL